MKREEFVALAIQRYTRLMQDEMEFGDIRTYVVWNEIFVCLERNIKQIFFCMHLSLCSGSRWLSLKQEEKYLESTQRAVRRLEKIQMESILG